MAGYCQFARTSHLFAQEGKCVFYCSHLNQIREFLAWFMPKVRVLWRHFAVFAKCAHTVL
ncbi:hypothetical protein D7V96_16240 [bacterium D16-59]|nr:hypothetical protein D7V96_16240 [bacterium D16-59]